MRIEPFNFDALRDFAVGKADPAAALKAQQALEAEQQKEAQQKAAPPSPPSYSQAELDQAVHAAKAAAFEEGRKAGLHEANTAQAQLQKQLEELMRQAAVQCAGLQNTYQSTLYQQGSLLSAMVEHLARKLAGDALKQDPSAVIRKVVVESIPLLLPHPKLVFQVHPAMVQPLHQQLYPILSQHGIEADCDIQAEESLGTSDIRIRFGAGMVERNEKQLLQSIMAPLREVNFMDLIHKEQMSQLVRAHTQPRPHAATAAQDTPQPTPTEE